MAPKIEFFDLWRHWLQTLVFKAFCFDGEGYFKYVSGPHAFEPYSHHHHSPLITVFHIGEYHVASRTGGGPPCLSCRYGFPAVLAFSRTGLYRHGVTAVLAFSRTGLIPPVLVIP